MFTLFLSPEISLYPYLISRGLIPYLNLIDQHFPLLFFGPLHLGQLGITTPEKSLILFFFILILTNLLALFHFRKNLIYYLLFIVFQIVFQTQVFWIESFVLLFLILYFVFPSALCLSFVLGLRPTLLPLAILLILFSKTKKIKSFLLVSIIPLLEIFWLYQNKLFSLFLEMQSFNTNFYAKYAAKLPTLREAVLVIFTLSIVFLIAYIGKKFRQTLLLTFAILILSYPRFGLSHLLPLSALIFFIPSVKLTKFLKTAIIFWLLIIIFVLRRQFFAPPVNYYYPQKLYRQAEYISKIINLKPNPYNLEPEIYFFGGPDQLYQLTNTKPIGDWYLPSLPWYFKKELFTQTQISVLKKHPESLVVVNQDSRVDRQSLLDYGEPIWNYIQQNYRQIDQIDNLTIYESRD